MSREKKSTSRGKEIRKYKLFRMTGLKSEENRVKGLKLASFELQTFPSECNVRNLLKGTVPRHSS
jgi:hypothetical protein